MDSLRDGKFQLANTNKLIRFYKGANGLKTGSTDKALCCLSGSAMRDNLQLICVVMAAPTSPQRFADASKMLDYGFANYAIKRIVTKDESLGDAPVVNGMAQTVPAVAKDDYDALTAKGDNTDIKRELVFNDTITAPIEIGDKIGEIQLSTAEGPLAAVDIVAAGNVAKMTYGAMLGRTLMAWLGSVK